MIKDSSIINSCGYALAAVAIAAAVASCNNAFNTDIAPPSANVAQPVIRRLELSKPKKIAWADVKAVPVRLVSTKLAWDKLPQLPADTTVFRPFKYPVQEGKFDYNTLPSKGLDIDKLPSHPLKFKTYMLPPSKLIKGAKPQLKDGNLYLLGVGEDQSSSGITVTRLLNDRDGFLWIACGEGVYRFDGENLLSFLSFPDEEEDYGMVQDSLGNIWLPNPTGPLMILEPKTGILKKSAPHQGVDSLQHLMIDGRQRIWATCQSGDIKIIDTRTQTIKVLNKKNGLFTTNRTAGIAEDKSGKIWISTGGGGVNIIDPKGKEIKHFDQAHGLRSDRTNNIVFDRDGRLWIGMYGGLINVIDEQKKSVQTISEIQSAAAGVLVSCLSEDDEGRIWIGTTASGATAIDLKKRMVMHLNKNNGLASNNVLDIRQDNRSQIWIATSLGLNIIGDKNAVLQRSGNDFVTNLMEDRGGLIWQGTYHGVEILDRGTNTVRHVGIKQGLANDTVHFIVDGNGKIYISTEHSLEILDTVKQTITHLESTYSNILFDKAGRICYLDKAETGINLYDPKNQTIKHFSKDLLQLNDYIYFLCLDTQGRIWLSNSYGEVNVIDPDAGTIQSLTNIKRDKRNGWVHFLPDDKGNIWMGSDRGIYIADPKDQTLIYLSAAQELIGNRVLSMVQYRGSVYASTGQGITVITPPAQGVSAKKRWRAVSYPFNKQNINSYNADLVTRDGVYWSGDAGITALDLAQIKSSKSVSYIKGISVYDHPMYFFDGAGFNTSATDTLWRQNGESYLSKGETPANTSDAFKSGLRWNNVTGPGYMPGNLQIPYNQNFIHFHYGNLNLVPHDITRYRYILNGVDKNWSNVTGDTSTVNYMNLQPGDYTFEVISRNADNTWSRPAKFNFTVNPPWWQTWWAYLFYAAVFAGTIWGFVRYRSHQLVKEKRVLENKVQLATEEIMQQNEEIAAQRDALEGNNHELKIEAALERVRARAMAMQKSEELSGLVATVIAELSKLDMDLSWCLITILDEASWSAKVWRANSQADQEPMCYHLPFAQYSFQKAIMKAWKERQEKWQYVLEGEEKETIDEYMLTRTDYSKLPEQVQAGIRAANPAYFYFSFGNFGGLQVGGPKQLSDASLDILARFGKVFDMTYTRFNDLKQAEAQALRAERDLVEIKAARKKAEETLNELQVTQKQLIQSEKMASLGELTAGIAHEIQNPLNFVNNFSEVSVELLEELKDEAAAGHTDDVIAIAADLVQNLEKIRHHGKRADGIVKGMLEHSRASTGQKQPTNINTLADEYLKLSYHGLRAKDKSFNAEMVTNFDEKLPLANVIPQDMGRVLLNLFNNAFYAVQQKAKIGGPNYKPTVEVITSATDNGIEISVKDNGIGMPDQVKEKIMQPFFTTKPTGEGTGLGLSLTYDMVVKGHGGNIQVNSVEGEGSEFIIQLPIN